MTATLHLPILLGTARDGNASQRIARYAERLLGQRPGVRTRILDAGELALGDLRVHAKMQRVPTAALQELQRETAKADGFVLVFPEYNHGYPGALKNMLDHLKDEWTRKPFAMVTTGGISGGMRAAENLLPVIRELKGVAVPTSTHVTGPMQTWSEDAPHDEASWRPRFEATLDDLTWWARALKAAREPPAAQPIAVRAVA